MNLVMWLHLGKKFIGIIPVAENHVKLQQAETAYQGINIHLFASRDSISHPMTAVYDDLSLCSGHGLCRVRKQGDRAKHVVCSRPVGPDDQGRCMLFQHLANQCTPVCDACVVVLGIRPSGLSLGVRGGKTQDDKVVQVRYHRSFTRLDNIYSSRA
jgi:hypothetical protein